MVQFINDPKSTSVVLKHQLFKFSNDVLTILKILIENICSVISNNLLYLSLLALKFL